MDAKPKSLSDAKGYKLSYELKPLQDGKSQWRVWLDVDEQLLEQVEQLSYAAPDLIPGGIGLKHERFSVQLGDGSPMLVEAMLVLKDSQKLRLTRKMLPRPDKLKLIYEARNVLLGESRSSAELQKLCKDLVMVDQFDYASELLLIRIRQDRDRGIHVSLKDYQDLAKYIYKDNSLSARFKFDRALRELNAADDLAGSKDCETLGLAGAIYKRKWQFDHQFKHLILARHYYERGYGLWEAYIKKGGLLSDKDSNNDKGWNAINYAYVLELTAVNSLEETGRLTAFEEFDAEGLNKAQKTRVYILNQFLENPFTDPRPKLSAFEPWMLATIAEAYFGLCRYDEALSYINAFKNELEIGPWELRTFGQQMFSIAYLQQVREQLISEARPALSLTRLPEVGAVDPEKIRQCLNALDIEDEADLEFSNAGKAGICLSGGGFRASLFHIGVLAALAERDELRNIEVISCVSGGSIIGAYYYLKLKLLLEEKSDDDITRDDYIKLVRETEKGFLKGVQQNLRMRIFSHLGSNFEMLSDDYSRTNRLGELYEEFLYKPIFEAYLKEQPDNPGPARAKQLDKYREVTGKNGRAICMNDLFINPEPDFVMDIDNWKRKNKVPRLILNATSVNTGHNWQFTASWMGEPAEGIISDIDVKSRLRRMYYGDAPEERYRNFRLGYAVGASSCVPVMFEPLPLNDLYPGIDLQLIDGGLHDNQGIAAILDEECKNVFISDASGQLPTSEQGVSGALSLFMRSDNILQERLRELQFLDMKERRSTTLINRLNHVHLKNGVTRPSVNWKNCTDPPRTISHVDPNVKDKNLMPYGVLRPIQQLISEIRTDLDAFHDIEAYALMYDGYVQTHYELGGSWDDYVEAGQWDFMAIAEYLKDPAKAEQISNKLAISSRVPFKLFHLMSKPLRIGLLVLLAALALGLLYYNRSIFSETISVKAVAITAAIFLLGMAFRPAAILLDPKGFIRKKLLMIGTAIVGWILFNGYVKLLNGFYLKAGRLKKK